MRVLLFTGKGGVGKTSVAAATGVRAAAAGLRTLVMSTDPAHSLADAFDVPLAAHPTPVAPLLDAEQVDAYVRLQEHWRDIQEYVVALLEWGGVGEIEAEELSVLPGLEEIFSLIDVLGHVDAGAYDLLVVDCAPTAETLRLLSLPDALGWYLERVFPVERTLAKAIRPVLGRLTTMPLPEDRAFGSVEALARNLARVRALLTDAGTTSVRLVVNAEKMVVAEARRTYAYLSLFGYHVDAVVMNRLIPDAVADPWFERWKRLQAEHLEAVREGFSGVPVLRAPLFDDELVGVDALAMLGSQLYGDGSPQEVLRDGEPLRIVRDGAGFVLDLPLPLSDKSELDLYQRGDELYVRLGPHVRTILLPVALRRCSVGAAVLTGGRLQVRFAPSAPADAAG